MRTTDQTVSPSATPKESRLNNALRQNFAAAEALLLPLLGDPAQHNGTAYYRAMHKLQAAFPNLSDSEIEALVAAVARSVLIRARG